jgi:hypothetical protein
MTLQIECPGCYAKVHYKPQNGWVDSGDGHQCVRGKHHTEAVNDLLGYLFHTGGKRALRTAGMANLLALPAWEETSELQRAMVFEGLDKVLTRLSQDTPGEDEETEG